MGVNDGAGCVGEALNEPRSHQPAESRASDSASGSVTVRERLRVAPTGTPDQLCAVVQQPARSVGERCVVRGSSGVPHCGAPLRICSASAGACYTPVGAGSLIVQRSGYGSLGKKRQWQQAAGEPRHECLKKFRASALQSIPQLAQQPSVQGMSRGAACRVVPSTHG